MMGDTMDLVGALMRPESNRPCVACGHASPHNVEYVEGVTLCSDWIETVRTADTEAGYACGCTEAERVIAQLIRDHDRLAEFLSEWAEEECNYDDNCPDFGSNHGKCTPCRAREVLTRRDG